MAKIVLYMTVSLDGYVAGPDDSVDAPMGIGGFRLFNWLDRRNDPGRAGRCTPRRWPPGRSSPDVVRTSWPAAGRATTTTAYRSSS
ncbi:hypothetical protein AB0J43_56480 [Nonomuraea fuscirosea]